MLPLPHIITPPQASQKLSVGDQDFKGLEQIKDRMDAEAKVKETSDSQGSCQPTEAGKIYIINSIFMHVQFYFIYIF